MRLIWVIFLYFLTVFAVNAKLPDIPTTTKIGQNQLQLPDKLLQTERGLWIADESGLYRVTGNKHLHFDSSNSPLEGSVTELLEDEFHNVWIATDSSGVLHFNHKTHEIKKIRNEFEHVIESCFDISVYKSKVYALCSDVLIEIDTEFTEVTKSILKEEYSGVKGEVQKTNSSYFIRQAKLDQLGNVWLSSTKYLYRYNVESMETEKFSIEYKMSEVYGFPYVLYVDSNNKVWLFGDTVAFLEKVNNKYQFKKIKRKCESRCFRFRVAFEDSSGGLWFASDSLAKYDEDLAVISDSKSLYPIFINKNYFIYDIEEGIYGEVYLASSDGVFELPNIHESINFYSKIEDSLGGDYPIDDLYIVNNKLHLFSSPHKKSFGVYDLKKDEVFTFPYNGFVIRDRVKYDSGSILYLSDDGDIFNFDIESRAFDSIRQKVKGIPSGKKFTAIYSNKKEVVIGTENGDIYKGGFKDGFNLIRSNLKTYKIFSSGKGEIYFSEVSGGVYRYNVKGEWKHWESLNDSLNVIKAEGCFYQDEKGVVWVCLSNGGFGYLDEYSNEIKLITSRFLNKHEPVYYMGADSHGLFWLSTTSNLVRYDPKTNVSINLDKSNGFFDVGYNNINRLPKDSLFIAGDNFRYIFNTEKARKYLDERLQQKIPILLHSFKVSDKRQNNSVNRIHEINLYHNSRPLEVTYDEYLITIEFAVNNFIERNNFSFEYRLLGLGDEWIQVSPQEGSATYSTLPAGDYTFEVRAVDKKSVAEQPITRLHIKVLPPFWLTWQAYSLYILAFLSLFYVIYRYRTQQLKQMNLQLETAVAERTSELASSNAHVSNLLKQKETLFANVSHEFRTPLTLISGPLEKLHKQVSGKENLQYFDILQRNTQRLTQLVEQILDLSHLETAVESERHIYDIETAIPILVESFKPLTVDRKQTLILSHHCFGGLELTKDALEKIMLNLLSNAIKYTPSGGTITVVVEEMDNFFCMRITDTGSGISDDDLEKIFERFTRLDNSDSEMGSGLGLALVKELVNTNNGQINVTSGLGEGTTFTVMFPLISEFDKSLTSSLSEGLLSINQQIQADIALDEQVSFTRESDGFTEKPTILIIEDNKDMRTFIQRSLQENYRCLTAKDGQEGIDLAIEHIPDLILSDLMMPVKDGFEVVDSIRQNEMSAHIPIILLTARGDDKSRLTGWRKEVDDYIPKPFNVDELLLRIARLISIRDIVKKRMRQAAETQVGKHIVNESIETTKSNMPFDYPKDHIFFNKLMDIIKSHYGDENFGRAVAAEKLAISERQLNRKMSAIVDYNFNELLRRFRLEQARMLIKSGKRIGDVCFDVGFTSPSYFSRCFKAEFGSSPKEFH